MKTVEVHRYPVPSANERASWPEGVSSVSDHWQGWVEDAERTWILFIAADGTVKMYDKRDENGGVIDPRGGSDLTCPPPPNA